MPKIPNNQVKTNYKKIGEQHIYIYSFNLVTTNQQYTLLSFKKKSYQQENKYKYPQFEIQRFKKFKSVKYQKEL